MTTRAPRNLARTLVGSASVAVGAAAIAAPDQAGSAVGVDAAGNGLLSLAIRFIGVRNLVMGLAALQADSPLASRRALRNGLLVGVADVAALEAAYRNGAVSEQTRTLGLAVLGGIAAVGLVGVTRR